MLKIKILIVSTLFSASAMAGTGWHITFVNKTSSSLHISEDRNEECWYSGSFDHENFIPKGSKERYYTEIKNSGIVFLLEKDGRLMTYLPIGVSILFNIGMTRGNV
ncbi:hypothetical protein [Photobacterium leiognathi]|uniref:hypothetical protein n=1 Tax=Photobacterium leiognathi TaxID=553611 RepID=UPI002738A54B|nr:hypothetical protein [Photobacterium leiognathi]